MAGVVSEQLSRPSFCCGSEALEVRKGKAEGSQHMERATRQWKFFSPKLEKNWSRLLFFCS